jgi:hypothetical protein
MADSLNESPELRLADALVADMMSLSTTELLAEFSDEEGEADAAVSRAIIARVLIGLVGGRHAHATRAKSPVGRDAKVGSEQTQFPKRIAVNDDRWEITLAARNGDGLSSRELQEIINDLRELGAFKDDDAGR